MSGSLGDLPELLIAFAALTSSLGGAAAAIIVALRAGRRQAVAVQEEREKNGPDTLPSEGQPGGLSVEDAAALMDLVQKMQPPGGGQNSGP
jgi:hypothetical protein